MAGLDDLPGDVGDDVGGDGEPDPGRGAAELLVGGRQGGDAHHLVSQVDQGPAATAGMQAGDVITKVNGIATPDTETLTAVLAGLRPGQRVPVTITKADGTTATVQVTLGQLPGT